MKKYWFRYDRVGACWCRRRHYVLGLSVRSSIVRLSVRPSVRSHRPLRNLRTWYFDNEWTDFDAKRQKASTDQGHGTITFKVTRSRSHEAWKYTGGLAKALLSTPLTSNLKLSGFFFDFSASAPVATCVRSGPCNEWGLKKETRHYVQWCAF